MAYLMPATVSGASLDGKKIVGAANSALDLSKFRKTAIPAGSNGRITTNGVYLVEANTPAVPVRFVGANVQLPSQLTKAIIDKAIARWKSKGYNFIRWQDFDEYVLGHGSDPADSTGNSRFAMRGHLQANPYNLDMMDYAVSQMAANGIYYTLSWHDGNAGMDCGPDYTRYDATASSYGVLTSSLDAWMTGFSINMVSDGAGALKIGSVTMPTNGYIFSGIAGTPWYFAPTITLGRNAESDTTIDVTASGGGAGAVLKATIDGIGELPAASHVADDITLSALTGTVTASSNTAIFTGMVNKRIYYHTSNVAGTPSGYGIISEVAPDGKSATVNVQNNFLYATLSQYATYFVDAGPATITLSAVTKGASVTATAGASIFTASDVGKCIMHGSSCAVITAVASGTSATVRITNRVAMASTNLGTNWCYAVYRGAVTGITVVDGGMGYTSAPTKLLFTGGNLTAKTRMFIDSDVRQQVINMLQFFLNRTNPYTGIKYANDPALVLMECANESSIPYQIGTGANIAYLQNAYAKWLYDRYNATLSTLTTLWGSAATSWTHAELNLWTKLTYDMSTRLGTFQFSEGNNFYIQKDTETLSAISAAIKATGFASPVITHDTVGALPFMKTLADNGDAQGIHYYISLLSQTSTNPAYCTAPSGSANANTSFFVGLGAQALGGIFQSMLSGKPRVLTEFGCTYPYRYRHEVGHVAAWFSLYDFSLVNFHTTSWYSDVFGVSGSISNLRSMNQCFFEIDPMMIGPVLIYTLAHLRGDIPALPVKTTYAMNPGYGGVYSKTQILSGSFATVPPVRIASTAGCIYLGTYYDSYLLARVENTWTATATIPPDSVTFPFYTEKMKSSYQNLQGFGADDGSLASESRTARLSFMDCGMSSNYVYQQTAYYYNGPQGILYASNRAVFYDGMRGIHGINTACTQAAVISSDLTTYIGEGPWYYDGSTYVSNPKNGAGYLKPKRNKPGRTFNKNYLGVPFFTNLVIDSAPAHTYIGLSSLDNLPIASSKRMLVSVGARVYNTGATFSGYAYTNTLTDFSGTPSYVTGMAANSNPPRVVIGNAKVLCTTDGAGAVVGYEIIDGGTTAPSSAALALGGSSFRSFVDGASDGTNSGTITGFGNNVVTASPNNEYKEIVMPYAQFTQMGTSSGWPYLFEVYGATFSLVGLNSFVGWKMYVLDYEGNRVGTIPVRRFNNKIQVDISMRRLASKYGPYTLFELVKE